MYRNASKHNKYYFKSNTNRLDQLEQAVDNADVVRAIPDLRRVIEITDYDSGEPRVHRLELYKSDRIDCYNVYVDGKLWKKRIGWSNILTGIRKALPRLISIE